MKKHTFSIALFALMLIGSLLAMTVFGHASAQEDRASQAVTQPLVCVPDSYESNESFAQAKPIAAGFFTPLSVCPADSDYFSIDLKQGYQLEVDLSFTHNLGDVELRIFDANQVQIASSSTSSDNESTAAHVANSGTHYIRVTGWTATVENTYEMLVNVSCADCISYQGQLQSSGNNANGSYEFEFELYDALADGSQIGEAAIQTLPVADGLFSAELYFGDPFDRADIYPQFLNIAVRPAGSTGAFTPLSPRTELTAAPVALTLVPGATISGTQTALNLHSSGSNGILISNAGDDGIQIDNASDDGIYIQNTGDEGIYIQNAGETGVFVDDASKAAIAGQNTSTEWPAGLFVNTNHSTSLSNHDGGVGIYARGKAGTSAANPDAADLVLGATSASSSNRTADDGRISSDPAYSSSDLEMASMDKVWALLDADNNTTGSYFGVYNHEVENANLVFKVEEDGDVFAKSYSINSRSIGRDGQPIVQHGLTSMQQRIEDFGTASLIDGVGSVVFSAEFTQVANTGQPYQVFLTPRGDCPLYLADTSASSFTVQAIGGATCSIDFDYRVSAEAIDIIDTEDFFGDDEAADASSERVTSEEVTP